MEYNINELEEVIEFKKCSKRFTVSLIILAVSAIPCIMLSLQILQGTVAFRNLIIYFIFLIFALPFFFITWHKYKIQLNVADNAVFKHIILKIGNEEIINVEDKNKLCIDFRQYLNNATITNLNHIFRLRRHNKTFDFFSYKKLNQTNVHGNLQYDIYAALLLEVASNDTLEKYENILLDKNRKYNFKYYMAKSNNKVVISVYRNGEDDITDEMVDLVAVFFKQIIEEIYHF